MRRTVVTGMGLVCPVGNSVPQAWSALVQGKSGIDTVPRWRDGRWQGKQLAVTVGGEVKDFRPEEWVQPAKDIRRMDRFIQLALAASQQAWDQAGFPQRLTDEAGNRAGTVVGVGLLGMDLLLKTHEVLLEQGPDRVSPFLVPGMIANLAPGHLSMRHNLRGANWSVASACASGTHAIGEALMHIQHGEADVMLAGGAESVMHPLAVAGFHSMRALCASKNESPARASQPFDRERDGFVMGEGAGLLVLEEYEHAKRRGADILAELVGYGFSSDAHHITAPAPRGEGAQRAMRGALAMAQMSPEDVDYMNAHGTSTPYNDTSETQAIHAVFGACARKLQLSSTKSMTGHLLGAAGGVEAVFSIQALRQSELPPTINYHTPDPECDLDYIPNEARACAIETAMSNSFGFGGANAVLLFRRVP
ncbi:MAG: beta-ketoacyl-ACP synthase II [Myxococcota bacterium]